MPQITFEKTAKKTAKKTRRRTYRKYLEIIRKRATGEVVAMSPDLIDRMYVSLLRVVGRDLSLRADRVSQRLS